MSKATPIAKRYLEQIHRELTEPVDTISVIDQGWTNLVFEVNGRWMFRFVRDKWNTQIAVERAFLPQFAPVSPVRVPEIFAQGEDYFAYPKIVGERFSAENFAYLTSTEQSTVLRQLGRFLTTLHNFEFSHPNLSDAPYGGRDFWHDVWPIVAPLLSVEVRQSAQTYFTKTLGILSSLHTPQTIIHADLGPNNTRLDLARRCLGGIIDFGDLSLGDPAADFASCYHNHGRDFVMRLLEFYERPIGEAFWLRVEYAARHKLFFAIYYAQLHDKQTIIPHLVPMVESLFDLS